MQTQQERIIAGFEQSRTLHEGNLSVVHGLTNHEWRRVMVDDLYLSDAEADIIDAALELYVTREEESIGYLDAAIVTALAVPTTAEPERCKRCRHTTGYTGPLSGGICGSCGDALREEAEAERMADLDGAFS